MVHNDKGVKKSIYLDYHSTTPVDPVIAERVMYYMTEAFGNPSSVTHDYSDEASQAVKDSTQEICNLINCEKGEILFTSGATGPDGPGLGRLEGSHGRSRCGVSKIL